MFPASTWICSGISSSLAKELKGVSLLNNLTSSNLNPLRKCIQWFLGSHRVPNCSPKIGTLVEILREHKNCKNEMQFQYIWLNTFRMQYPMSSYGTPGRIFFPSFIQDILWWLISCPIPWLHSKRCRRVKFKLSLGQVLTHKDANCLPSNCMQKIVPVIFSNISNWKFWQDC